MKFKENDMVRLKENNLYIEQNRTVYILKKKHSVLLNCWLAYIPKNSQHTFYLFENELELESISKHPLTTIFK